MGKDKNPHPLREGDSASPCAVLYVSGRPILAMIGQGAADLINDSKSGYAVAPSDYKALAEVIINRVLPDKSGFEQMGRPDSRRWAREIGLDFGWRMTWNL